MGSPQGVPKADDETAGSGIVRSVFSERVERARNRHDPIFGSPPGERWGQFNFHHGGVRLVVIASDGSNEITWEHVSVSTKTRCPTWEEMALMKTLFWNDDEAVMQLHPPRGDYVSFHPYCLHLWKPTHVAVPLPPAVAVGPKDLRAEDLTQHERVLLQLAFASAEGADRAIKQLQERVRARTLGTSP